MLRFRIDEIADTGLFEGARAGTLGPSTRVVGSGYEEVRVDCPLERCWQFPPAAG